MSLSLHHAGLSDTGRSREKNQDQWIVDEEINLFLVSDGIGGNFAGEVASKIVAEALPLMIRARLGDEESWAEKDPKHEVSEAIVELSNSIRDKTENQPGMEGMGATVVLALIRGDLALIAHMGDSRAYLHRDERLEQLTHDHSIVQLLIDNHELTPEEAQDHPARGQLSRSVGMGGEPIPEVQEHQLKSGDQLLLCTDGLTGMIRDREILSILDTYADVQAASKKLVDAANEAGGKDNITAVLISLT